MSERFLSLPPRVRWARTVCTVCACVIEPALQAAHLAVCPVVHPEKEKVK